MKTGQTTRVIDRCIQELFNNKFTFLYDERNSEFNQNTYNAFIKFCRRLHEEHNCKINAEEGVYSGIWCYKITLL